MVEVTRLTREEVKATLAELDAKHPAWRQSWNNRLSGRVGWVEAVSGWMPGVVEDAVEYDVHRFLLGEDE